LDDVRLVGEIERWGRKLYLAVVADLGAWSPDLSRVPTPFSALCALAEWETSALEPFAEQLISAGCRDVHSWGPLGDDVHLAVDMAFIRRIPRQL
jgi:hypothetical protein